MFIGDLIGEVYRKRLRQYLDWYLLPPHKIFWNPEENDPKNINGSMVIKLLLFFFWWKHMMVLEKSPKTTFCLRWTMFSENKEQEP